MRLVTRIGLFAVVLVSLCNVAAAQKTNNVATFMRIKLQHAQKVLEALALEDFDGMAKNAQEISLLSQASTWQVLQTPEYRQHSVDFRRTVNSLREAAKKKNLDGASLAYVEMTLKCVQCHKYVRRIRMASVDPPMLLPPKASATALSRLAPKPGAGLRAEKPAGLVAADALSP